MNYIFLFAIPNLFFSVIKIVSILLSLVIIAINIYFVYNTVDELELSAGLIAAVIVYGVLYLLFCVYLGIHLAVSMGNQTLAKIGFVQKYVMVSDSKLSINI